MREIRAKTWTPRTRPLAYAHAKRDGIWLCVNKDMHGRVTMNTSHPTDVTAQLRTCGWTLPVHERVPPITRVLGELYVPGESRSQVKSALAHDSSRLRFAGFAIATAPVDLELRDVNDTLTLWGIETIQYRVHSAVSRPDLLIGEYTYTDPSRLLDETPEGHEGWVLKNGNMLDWHKLKVERTIDLVVTGTKDGRGKYLGLVGALRVSTSEGYEVARVGGMSDEERVAMTEEDPTGRVCEVRYQYVGDRGRLQHPRFLHWRDDKTPDECPASQDPALEEHWR